MECSLRHVGIVVNDIQEWAQFLVEVLGFELIADAHESGAQLDSSLGLEGIKVHVMKYSDHMGSVIELLSFKSHIDDKYRKEDLFSLGIRHIALTVTDIELTLSKISRCYGEPKGRITISKDGRVKMIYVRGPEGCLFELVEELQ